MWDREKRLGSGAGGWGATERKTSGLQRDGDGGHGIERRDDDEWRLEGEVVGSDSGQVADRCGDDTLSSFLIIAEMVHGVDRGLEEQHQNQSHDRPHDDGQRATMSEGGPRGSARSWSPWIHRGEGIMAPA